MDKTKTKKPAKSSIEPSAVLRLGFSNLSQTGRGFKQIISMFADSMLCVASLWGAYTLRLEEPYTGFSESWYLFLILPIFAICICGSFGVYRWVIRTSTKMLSVQLVKATVLLSIALLILLFLFPPHESNPRSLFILFGMLFVLSTIGIRAIWQSVSSHNSAIRSGEPVAIFGAGSAGQQLARLMSLAPEFRPEFFIDDDRGLVGSTVSGLRVYDDHDESLRGLLKKNEITRIILAVPSLKGERYTEVLERMSQFSLPVQTTPSVTEIVEGRASPDEIRDVSISDLLGRTQVEPDSVMIRKCVESKNVMVTGGGGSIGSEICRQIMQHSPEKLIILEQSEENLYKISEEIHSTIQTIVEGKNNQKAPLFVPVLGSVTDATKVNSIIAQHKIDTIYHAAAYKHVPIVEQYPEEGVAVNVFGTKTVLDAAIDHSVETFVLISTDKAVRPSNAMGASKRVAELLLQAKAREVNNTRICMVRFGNVLGSSGSVVPKFTQQIKGGGPITLTHPDITRYFMTIPEASQLVLQASALANAGEVFVLDMGEPVKILDLATKMIKLHGKETKSEDNPSGDIEVKITGMRPGEKMYEELFMTDDAEPTSIDKIRVENVSFQNWSDLEKAIVELRRLLDTNKSKSLKDLVMNLAWSTEEINPVNSNAVSDQPVSESTAAVV